MRKTLTISERLIKIYLKKIVDRVRNLKNLLFENRNFLIEKVSTTYAIKDFSLDILFVYSIHKTMVWL